MLSIFLDAINAYGLPQRIRCDQGVENYDAAMYMLTHPSRDLSMRPVIVGKSVHNQRIKDCGRMCTLV